MTNSENVKIFDDGHAGVILQCNDREISDQFDDFLIANLDKDVLFKFENEYVLFFFGKDLSIEDVTNLYWKFLKEISVANI